MKVKSLSRLTLSDPMDCSLPGSSVHGIFPGKNTGVGCHCLLPNENGCVYNLVYLSDFFIEDIFTILTFLFQYSAS